MKLGTSLRFLYPTGAHTHALFKQMLEATPPGSFIERPLGLRAMKEAALRYIALDEAAAIAAIPAISARVLGTEDATEGIRSFVERREARFSGR